MLLFQEIRNYIHQLLADKSIAAGDKLPSERALQEQFNSTRITVREALLRLEAEGLIYSQKRRGWFVTPAKLKWHPATKVNFYELAKQQGFKADTFVINLTTEANFSDSGLSAPNLYHLQRVRSLDNRAVMYEDIYCDAQRFKQLESHSLNGSITDIMATQYNTLVCKESSVISVTVLPDHVAIKLEKNSGTPCLKVIRKRYDECHTLVDHNIEYWLHNAIEMIVEGQ
ncbi:GntR family transcriptional regulator [Pseudoalteromonas sp. KAN5]|uniref:GntR family transcriptional regulator n=1 Tax=Pseudoalteromonas sp. KAN5 TaxID=2916633 RepID=UPI001FCC369D|nr:GntR family transcriptional regulator [Pseudoalteromonas sp. KAN5]BDF94135.1 transcriptional regulator [Pseudoalteromonas sp. KAN5]